MDQHASVIADARVADDAAGVDFAPAAVCVWSLCGVLALMLFVKASPALAAALALLG